MTILHPLLLILALAPLIWAAVEWRRTTRRLALALKALTICAIIAALSEPVLHTPETKTAVALLADTSASITATDLQDASRFANAAERARGRNWLRVLPFAEGARDPLTNEHKGGWRLVNTASDAGEQTDLEAAIRGALASMPAGLVPRIVLVSDGRENAGSVARAAWQARSLGVPVDTIALHGRPEPALRVESVTMPSLVFTGEHFPIEILLNSPHRTPGSVGITAEGKLLGSTPITLDQGENDIHVNASIAAAGVINLGLTIRDSEHGEETRIAQAVTLRRPRVLFCSQDPEGTEINLLSALTAAQFDIDRTADPLHGRLSDFQMAVFNNLDLENLAAARKDEIEQFVKSGGGLLVVSGERNVYAENKKIEDALDRTLPATLAPPRSPEGTAVILIIDKSSSMEGRKIELARTAAIGVVENLRPIDMVGVLIFDNSFQWTVPIRYARDRKLIERLISGITPDGGTQIAPALAEAYHRVLPVPATFKHIVLLTDGISEEGDSIDLARDAHAQRVTISTVGLGQDVNRAYLEKVASMAGGKSYFLNEPSGLAQLLLRDVMEHTGSGAVEKPLHPTVVKRAEVIDGVGIESAPPLKGYIRWIAKPTSDTILGIGDKDPLLVRWQYGLGRSVIFASDAKSRWASNWIGWKGYDRFWANVFRDLLPHAETTEAKTDYDSGSGDLIVTYHLGHGVEEPRVAPALFAIGPQGFERPVTLSKLGDGSYRARVSIGQRQGLFRVRPLEESHAFPEVGIYRQEQEMQDYGSNTFLLKQVAAYTGGRFNPTASQIFDPGGRSIPSTTRLWPLLLAFAIVLNVAELALRKARPDHT